MNLTCLESQRDFERKSINFDQDAVNVFEPARQKLKKVVEGPKVDHDDRKKIDKGMKDRKKKCSVLSL